MGMGCGRNGCDSIMYDVSIFGRYICGDCLNELREAIKHKFSEKTKKGKVKRFVEAFMESKPGDFSVEEVDAEEILEDLLDYGDNWDE